jgi:hypothetical protein
MLRHFALASPQHSFAEILQLCEVRNMVVASVKGIFAPDAHAVVLT